MLKTTVLQAGSPTQYWQSIKEILHYTDLLRMLSYRDIKVRYAQTILGLAWAVINPVVSMLLLYFVFGVVAKVDTREIPPLLFTMAGLSAWTYFARVVGESGMSVIGAQSLVKKVYFPRLIIPLSKAMSALIDLLVVLLLLLIMMVWYGIPFTWQALMIFPFIAMAVLAGMGFGVWIAALTIRFRDFTHIVPLLLRIGMFISPIAYGASMVPGQYRWAFDLNPLSGIIEGIRWALFNTPLDPASVWASLVIIVIILFSGTWYFLRMDKYIADII